MEPVLIYTDGSSLGNPGPGGWGAIVAAYDRVEELGGFEQRTTNNRMELAAVREALGRAARMSDGIIIIRTDSAYVLQGATMWGKGWKRRGWKTLDGKDVLNRDLWEPFFEFYEPIAARVRWEKVGGHISIPGNERADTIATTFAAGEKPALYAGARAAYGIDLDTVVHDDEAKQKRSDSKAHAKAKAYSYVSLVGNEISIHKTWDSCKTRVEGQRGAKYRKATSEADEAAIIEEFSKHIS